MYVIKEGEVQDENSTLCDFSSWQTLFKTNGKVAWIDNKDILRWYQAEKDLGIVEAVAGGNKNALQWFLEQGNVEVQKRYLQNIRYDNDMVGTLKYAQGDYAGFGWSLLNTAAFCGQPDMVEFLIRKVGMDPNTECFGIYPISCCFVSFHAEDNTYNPQRIAAAAKFLELGTSPDKGCTAYGKNNTPSNMIPLFQACHIPDSGSRGKALELLVEYMREKNSNFETLDNLGRNALHHLIITSQKAGQTFQDFIHHIELLVAAGVDPLQKNNERLAPGDLINNPAQKEIFRQTVVNALGDKDVDEKGKFEGFTI